MQDEQFYFIFKFNMQSTFLIFYIHLPYFSSLLLLFLSFHIVIYLSYTLVSSWPFTFVFLSCRFTLLSLPFFSYLFFLVALFLASWSIAIYFRRSCALFLNANLLWLRRFSSAYRFYYYNVIFIVSILFMRYPDLIVGLSTRNNDFSFLFD